MCWPQIWKISIPDSVNCIALAAVITVDNILLFLFMLALHVSGFSCSFWYFHFITVTNGGDLHAGDSDSCGRLHPLMDCLLLPSNFCAYYVAFLLFVY